MSDYVELGQMLRSGREDCGKTIADLSEEMGLPESYLQALENGDIGLLPDPTYARIYFINYARTLGLDTESLMLQWPRQTSGAPTVQTRSPRPIAWRMPAAGLVAALVVVWLFVQLTGGVDGDAEDGDNTSGTSDAPPLAVTAVTDSNDTLAADTAAVVAAADTTIVDPTPRVSALTVLATGESWVVVESDGDTVEARVMLEDQSITVEALNEFALTAASPQNLTVELNGATLTLPQRPGRPLIRHRIATRGGTQ
jgi:cytoskeletal protein RodZ